MIQIRLTLAALCGGKVVVSLDGSGLDSTSNRRKVGSSLPSGRGGWWIGENNVTLRNALKSKSFTSGTNGYTKLLTRKASLLDSLESLGPKR